MRAFFLRKIMSKIFYRYLLISIALFSIILGLLGIFLPILPTTPFFILALACFARSSPLFHQKLLNAPIIGKTLQDWEKDKKIEKQRKLRIYLIVIVTFLISITLVYKNLMLQLLLVFIMAILLLFIRNIDEK